MFDTERQSKHWCGVRTDFVWCRLEFLLPKTELDSDEFSPLFRRFLGQPQY